MAYSTVTNFTTLPGRSVSLVVNTLLDVTNKPILNSLRDAISYAYQLNDVATITFVPSLFTNRSGHLGADQRFEWITVTTTPSSSKGLAASLPFAVQAPTS